MSEEGAWRPSAGRVVSAAAMPKRDWRLHCHPWALTCHECGRSIMPMVDCYFDMASGHLVRHAECHEKAEARK